MKIYVDADGCPVVNNVVSICRDYGLDVVIVKNYAHKIDSDYASIISVDISRDSVDFFIVNKLEKGDLVVTQDYGLAAMCLSRQALAINQNGIVYSDDNMDGMLNSRHFNMELRRQGKFYGKSPKRKLKDNKAFDLRFRSLIEGLINKNPG